MGGILECQFNYIYYNEFYDRFPRKYRNDYISSNGQVKLAELFAADLPSLDIPLLTIPKETETDYVEMGPLQAIDCINALMTVRGILDENGYTYNKNKTLVYGHSHGAYLALLANRLSPNLFSLIIDGSAWVLPLYLSEYRRNDGKHKNHNIIKYTKYRIANQNFDSQIRDLSFLYKNFNKLANIISYHGIDDVLVDARKKAEFFVHINNSTFKLITSEQVDDTIFKSTAHGDFDFVQLLNHVFTTYPDRLVKTGNNNIYDQIINTDCGEYSFYIENFGPHMVFKPR